VEAIGLETTNLLAARFTPSVPTATNRSLKVQDSSAFPSLLLIAVGTLLVLQFQ
jgi:hypothetical protein